VILVDLLGKVLERHSVSYALPVASDLLQEIKKHLVRIQAQLAADNKKLIGIGIARPFAMSGWNKLLGLTQAQADEWRALDITAAVQAMANCPVKLAKDTSAACIAELLNGQGRNWHNFLYFFVDTFIGGSVVSQGRLLESTQGNAGAVASLPMSVHKPLEQLQEHASLLELEQNPAQTEAWLGWASYALAFAVVSGTAFLDTDAVVIDGSMPPELLKKLIEQTQEALSAFNWEGIWKPKILAGLVGSDAGAIGGALLPLHDYFYA
jgi:predicted NBD/HSP70 family sugar kinase